MKNYFNLTGRVALITGCSTGLGVQMARALANQGCNIIPVARRQKKITEVAKMFQKDFGITAFPTSAISSKKQELTCSCSKDNRVLH